MVDRLLEGMTVGLKAVFGQETVVVTDDRVQPPARPGFYLRVNGASRRRMLGDRHREEVKVSVRYLSTQEGDERALQQVGEQLFSAVQWVPLGELERLHGTQMAYEIKDGALWFSVVYAYFLADREAQEGVDKMDLRVSTSQGSAGE